MRILQPRMYCDDHLYQARISWAIQVYGIRATFERLLNTANCQVIEKPYRQNISGAEWDNEYIIHVPDSDYIAMHDKIMTSNLFFMPISLVSANHQQ